LLDDDVQETAKSALPTAPPSVNDLRKSPRKRNLAPEKERGLIVAAQAGDDKAMRKLIDHHIGWIRWQASLRWQSVRRVDPSADAMNDLVSVGIAEFARHVLTWKPPYALNTHYRKAVIGALADASYVHRNVAALGGMESDIQRFMRAHPNVTNDPAEMKAFCRCFPNLTKSEFEFELNTYRNVVTSESYSEAGTGDDDGDGGHDPKAEEAFQTDKDADIDSADVSEAIGQWTLTASRHDKRDRYFADGFWSVWNPPPHVGWERRELNDRLAPILKVADLELFKFAPEWRPQSGYVDENDYRGLGEGASSLRSCAVKSPPQMPVGQDDRESLWNYRPPSKRRSINPDGCIPHSAPFDEMIASTIGATDIATPSNDNEFKQAA
jgi:hypothetical protein